MNEQLQQPKNYNWTPGESYYEDIAESHVNDAVHVIGRLALGLYSYIRLGRPKVVVDPEFKEMKDIVAQGNGLVASVHRLDLDTVLLPSALERAGLHHARPMSKIELFQKRLVRWGLHKLGAFAVDRNVDAVDMDGLAIAQKGILKRTETTEKKRYGILRRKERNGIVTIYPEATRINKDTLRVAKIKRGLAITAIENSSWIVPVGIAGCRLKSADRVKIKEILRGIEEAGSGYVIELCSLWVSLLSCHHTVKMP